MMMKLGRSAAWVGKVMQARIRVMMVLMLWNLTTGALLFFKRDLDFQNTHSGIFPGGHIDPNRIALCRGRRMDDIELIGPGVVFVGGVKFEWFPLAILLDFDEPIFGELYIALPAVHPEYTDAAYILCFATAPDDPLVFARLTSAGPARNLVPARPLIHLTVADCGYGIFVRRVGSCDFCEYTFFR